MAFQFRRDMLEIQWSQDADIGSEVSLQFSLLERIRQSAIGNIISGQMKIILKEFMGPHTMDNINLAMALKQLRKYLLLLEERARLFVTRSVKSENWYIKLCKRMPRKSFSLWPKIG